MDLTLEQALEQAQILSDALNDAAGRGFTPSIREATILTLYQEVQRLTTVVAKSSREPALRALRDLTDVMTGCLAGETAALHNALEVLQVTNSTYVAGLVPGESKGG